MPNSIQLHVKQGVHFSKAIPEYTDERSQSSSPTIFSHSAPSLEKVRWAGKKS